MTLKIKSNSDIRKPIVALFISSAAFFGIQKYEGVKLDAYVALEGDPVTIGAGTTVYPDGTKVQKGDKITRQQVDEFLKNDINRFHTAMTKCIKVPITQYEYDAYISLTYNIGSGAFCKSTLVKRLNQYDYEGACKEILKWDKFKGKPLRGLTTRRQQEYQTCIGSTL